MLAARRLTSHSQGAGRVFVEIVDVEDDVALGRREGAEVHQTGDAALEDLADFGIVLGGSGQGEQLAANKVRGVRAALCNDLYTARMARAHNDANVLSIGARVVGIGLAEEIVTTFLSTPFEGGRHARRVAQLMELENDF